MCDIGDLEEPAVWRQTTHKARKFHRCACCHGLIRPGEKYVKHFSVYDGNVTDEKQCLACEALSDEYAKHHEGVRGTPSYMLQLLVDCIDEEKRAGNAEMADKWSRAIDEMNARHDQQVPIK